MSLFRVWSLEFRVISGWQVGHLSHSSASVSQRDVGPLFCWRNKWSLWSWCRCSHGCSAWTAASSSQRSSQAFPTQAWYCYDGGNSLCIVDGGTPQAYFTFALFAASFCSLWLRSLWTKLLHARLNTKLGRILVVPNSASTYCFWYLPTQKLSKAQISALFHTRTIAWCLTTQSHWQS